MGLHKLSPLAKQIASLRVSLQNGHGQDHVVIDGGFLNHRMKTRGGAAYGLVIKGDVLPHVKQCAKEIQLIQSRGYEITVVFDGKTPPVKLGTSQARKIKREENATAARLLVNRGGGSRAEINKLASNACVFDSRTIAQIAALLRGQMKGEVYIAPG